ncbi:hypothetical protein A4X09_0g4927 [Tilletia walkeri]|uniref:Uncharacterized protein n=1 Tax=Tilletia walkeri TaxID=117179 RepID=A0A8X7N5D8_9BASI|nr:hypothetical protein A4X09_0g4927 [Tilletia walkeri]
MGTADVAARGRMHCVEAKDSQAGASRQQTTDFVRRRRARAARASDNKTSNATGKGISATRRSGRAIGRLGRQDAGHGTTRSTARTDWVGKSRRGTFPPRGWSGKTEDDSVKTSAEQVIQGSIGSPLSAGTGRVGPGLIMLTGLTGEEPGLPAGAQGSTSATSQRRQGYGASRPARQPGPADVAARERMHCVETKDSQAGASRQQTTDFVRRRRARAACNSDGKMNDTVDRSISSTLRVGRRDTRTWDGPGGRRSMHMAPGGSEVQGPGGHRDYAADLLFTFLLIEPGLPAGAQGSTSATSQRRLGVGAVGAGSRPATNRDDWVGALRPHNTDHQLAG